MGGVFGGGGGPGRLLRTTYFTASGTWTKLADVKSIVVECVGGGGGGAGASTQNGAAGGGGGGGAYGRKLFQAAALDATEAVTVGAGGAGNVGAAGGNGGTTLFKTLSVEGGLGANSIGTNNAVSVVGQRGGTTVAGHDFKANGQYGSASMSNATVALAQGGRGGSSGLSFGAGGEGDVADSDNEGKPGISYGGGGGGGVRGTAGVSRPGGAGAAGVCIVHEYS